MKNKKSSGTLTLNTALEMESSELNKLFNASAHGMAAPLVPQEIFSSRIPDCCSVFC